MTNETDPSPSPRLERLLRADAGRMPAGLASRVFEASVRHLPERQPLVFARVTHRWIAAAAALLLAVGAALRLGSVRAHDEGDAHATIAGVIDAADETSLGEDLRNINAVRGVRLADLDDEMRFVLADGRVDG